MASRIILLFEYHQRWYWISLCSCQILFKKTLMFVIFPKQNISEDKSSYFFFTFTLCPGLQKRFHRYLKMHLYVLEYILVTNQIFNTRRCYLMSSDTNSLAHTKWNCKYHIVFAPKYRRQVIYGKIKGILELFCVNYVKEKA